MSFPYKVVAITGASTGLGRAMALQLAQKGCSLGLIARRQELLDEVAARVTELGGKAIAVACDVADNAQVVDAVAKIEHGLGAIECMIANAGIGQPLEPRSFEVAVTERIYQVNVMGAVHAFYAVIPGMTQRKQGHLVAVASLAGYQGLPADGGYAGSKAALRVHAEGLRIELRGTGIAVSTICPGFVRTPLTDKNDFDMPLLLEADNAATRMLKAIARKRRMYNFPLLLWWLTRLGSLAPRFVYDAFLAWQANSMRGKRKQRRSDEA
jgi:short-subunit dehydrogenase